MSEFKRVGRFELVSFNEFKKAFEDRSEEEVKSLYEGLKLPKRATKGSAGYDFYLPFDIVIKPGETIKVPTGIRVYMYDNYVLKIYPRSGLGFKYRIQLNNTVGIIDSDYYNSSNEGHIFIKITNDSNEGKILEAKCGEGFAQGIFVEYFITFDDEVSDIRDGGLGSTTK